MDHEAQVMQTIPGGEVVLRGLSLKRLSFDSRVMAFPVEARDASPHMELMTEWRNLEGEHYEVVLGVKLGVNVEGREVFRVDVAQAGVFRVSGIRGPDLQWVMGTRCAKVLYRAVRKVVEVVVEGSGFGQIELLDLDFDAMYARETASSESAGETPPPRMH
ncbi:MAG: hypothetical protein B7Z66_12055 [Chromatiales bacterium 21-64-14]|nr:MAG: hypothetical protein B7Z66_12055 [Chromatiales bacterium 21-64-14]